MTQQFGRRKPGPLECGAMPVTGDWKRPTESGVRETGVVEQSLGAWQLERKRSARPYSYIFAATGVLGLVASFTLPDGLALMVRIVLFGAGLTAITVGRKRWAGRSRTVTETTFEV